LILAAQPVSAATPSSNTGLVWQTSGLTLPSPVHNFCYDADQPDHLLVSKLVTIQTVTTCPLSSGDDRSGATSGKVCAKVFCWYKSLITTSGQPISADWVQVPPTLVSSTTLDTCPLSSGDDKTQGAE
jgi:hypothetical protein